jgi:pyruvate-ferredoxin/flavodoxin oxidoreductase
LPKSVKRISVLDRTKEPGSAGEPLYLDIVNALTEAYIEGKLDNLPKITGGRYGLSSKEFTPAMVKAVFDEMKKDNPKNHFTIGIIDDVTNTSLEFDRELNIEDPSIFRGMFYGLGADGTVGANKNSIKIIGEETENYAQGYFVYDSKKSGSMTTSHLRFGPKPIRSTYLITKANFIACHQPTFLDKIDMLANAEQGATFLLNTPLPKDKIFDELPLQVQKHLIEKKIKFYVIDAIKVAKETGMGQRINSIMQTCFFAISNILPKVEAISKIKQSIEKTYGKKGDAVVKMNWDSVDKTLENLYEVAVPDKTSGNKQMKPAISGDAPEFVKKVTAMIIEGKGDLIPVSMLPEDGTYPTGTAKWEKRNIALEVPVWDTEICIQCNKCALVCPHATIRAKVYNEKDLINVPEGFKYTKYRGKEYGEGAIYSLQVAVEDCTGCGICVEVCPAKNKKETRLKAINMVPADTDGLREQESRNLDYFLSLPEIDRTKVNTSAVKDSQFLEPLFEFSGACLGCGETPYLKLVSQLFGDRAIIANATGCSSIYGGNLPTTPWQKNSEGRGPAWSNSLFEDNAEFGMGFRLAIDKHQEQAEYLLKQLSAEIGENLVNEILEAKQSDEFGIIQQRARIYELKKKLKEINSEQSRRLEWLSDYLVKKSVWIVGGDGWAYDIGFGGLDHVLLSGKDVNMLVLDTEVYSNTGGQTSKSTPRAAVAKFSAAGKTTAKKDLGLLAVSYGNVYVARVAFGASDTQTIKAFAEAESYNGPSLIIAYSHCIAHGINMRTALQNQKAAVDSAYWPLFRFNPDLIAKGENPFKLDSKPPKIKLAEYAYMETRYKMLTKSHPEEAKQLMRLAQEDVNKRWKMYEQLAQDYEKAFAKN